MIAEIKQVANKEKALPAMWVLLIRHLYKSFGDNHVLVDFNLEVAKGESVVVLGKSGSGKSVLSESLRWVCWWPLV